MTAIITGDIIDSKQLKTAIWLNLLKDILGKYGENPKTWEIFRGDSFQLEVAPENALKVAILIKAILKQQAEIDVRMAIGIGEKEFSTAKITESNGSAFVNSGECFENLKKNTMAIKTPWQSFDSMMNIMLELALITMDNWSSNSANLVRVGFENPTKNQQEIAILLKKTQSTISEGFKRAAFEEVLKMISFYTLKIKEKC